MVQGEEGPRGVFAQQERGGGVKSTWKVRCGRRDKKQQGQTKHLPASVEGVGISRREALRLTLRVKQRSERTLVATVWWSSEGKYPTKSVHPRWSSTRSFMSYASLKYRRTDEATPAAAVSYRHRGNKERPPATTATNNGSHTPLTGGATATERISANNGSTLSTADGWRHFKGRSCLLNIDGVRRRCEDQRRVHSLRELPCLKARTKREAYTGVRP